MKKFLMFAALLSSMSFASKANTISSVQNETKAIASLQANTTATMSKPLTYLLYCIEGYDCAPAFDITIDDSDMASATALISFYVDQQMAIAGGC